MHVIIDQLLVTYGDSGVLTNQPRQIQLCSIIRLHFTASFSDSIIPSCGTIFTEIELFKNASRTVLFVVLK